MQSHNFALLALSSITVLRDDRQRREIQVQDLAASIAKIGILNPLIVTRDGQLVAGERRLAAATLLGLAQVPVRYMDDLTLQELQVIELEENIKRKELAWQDHVRAVHRIHQLYLALDPEWTQDETADELSMTKGHLSKFLRIAREFHTALGPLVLAADGPTEAWNIIARKEQRASGTALQELIDGPSAQAVFSKLDDDLRAQAPAELYVNWTGPLPEILPRPGVLLKDEPPTIPILCESFLEWALLYTGPKFNFIHCDFPYGLRLFDGLQGRGAEPTQGYDDSPEIYEALLRCLCTNLSRLMSLSGHLMFWYSAKHEEMTRRLFRELAPSLDFHPYPLIWFKSDNAGISGDHRRSPRHVYETALLASRGARQIVRIKADCYAAPTQRDTHASAKPEPMLRHFFEMLVDETSSVLDPTCGSGSALRAAESLGAQSVLGLEIDPGVADQSRVVYKNWRAMRSASKALETL